MSKTIASTALPSAMEEKLQSIRRRQVVLAVLRAVAVGTSVLLAAMVAAMTVDWWFTLFHTGVRTALTSASLVLAAAALLATGVPALIEVLGWTRAAASADDHVPQLEERWTTVASIAASNHQPATPTARAMLQQVTSEAVAMGRLVQPGQVARPAAIRPAGLKLAACGLLLAGFLALDWAQTSVLLRRFWLPTGDITATQLKSATGNVEVPRGESLDLVTELSGLPRDRAELELATGAEIVDVFELQPDANRSNAFVYRLTVDESFRYRVRSGDGQTPWHSVTAIDHPALGEVRLTVTPPDYVDRPKFEKTLIPSRVKVVQGSRLQLLMKPLAPLEKLELALTFEGGDNENAEGPREQRLALTPDAEGWYRFEAQLLEDMSLSPTLHNSYGLTNEHKQTCRIQVVPDKPPVARIVSPTDEMAVAADDVIDVKFEAHDDHGVATAELLVYGESETEDGQEPKLLTAQPIPLGDQRLEKHIMASAKLDLKKLNLNEGTNISYAIRVTDNRSVQLDPQALQAQIGEAKPGEADDEPQAAGNGDRSDQQQGGKERRDGRYSPDDLGNVVAARDPSTKQRSSEASAAASRPNDVEPPRNEDAAARSESGKDVPAADSPESRPRDAGKRTDDPGTDAGTSPQDGTHSDRRGDTLSGKASPESQPDDASEATKPGGEGGNPSKNGNAENPDSPSDAESKDTNLKDREPQPGDGESAVASSDGKPAGEKPTKTNKNQESTSDNADSRNGEQTADGTRDRSPNSDAEDEANTPEDKSDSASRPLPVASNDAQPRASEARIGNDPRKNKSDENASGPGASDPNDRRQSSQQTSIEQGPPRDRMIALNPLQAETGQNAETVRRKLKITARLTAVAAATERKTENMAIRDRVVHIDTLLAGVEAGLTRLVERNVPDADRSEQFRRLDTQLGDVEAEIADLRNETMDHQFAFVGLQMVDIGRTHVTPARDQVFIGIREPLGSDNATVGLQHVVRARELLAALLKRYDRVARDQELAATLDETVKMYEVYVEKMQQLMREARQNRNPLQRKMAIIEVDQDYLDRYAEVLTLRREMLAEFARLLGDDPRLLARYIDLIKRRRTSLRDQLSELAERQEAIATELAGWLQVGEAQRGDLWTIVAEMRLHSATPLAKDAAELAERIVKQMPLSLEADQGTAALVIGHAQHIARLSRQIAFDARRMLQQPGQPDESAKQLVSNAEQLVYLFGELDAALDQLNFENETDEEVAPYVTARLLESRTVADHADEWLEVARNLQHRRYHGLAQVDQEKLSVATELLRVEMLGIEADLRGEFQQQTESELPSEIITLIRELHQVMEGITFNQPAAAFAMTQDRLPAAQLQQAKAVEGFARAEELFDQIRRAVVAALDEYDPPDPNIADLRDPTLDEFLAQLEREPNIEAQLGLPNRPRNLRVIADAMIWQQQGGDMLGDSGDAAMQRARQAMRMEMERPEKRDKPEEPEAEMTEEQRQQLAKTQKMQEELEKALLAIREKAADPKTSPEQRRRMEQMAENMERMLEQMGQRNLDADDWERIAEADKAKDALQALARGEAIPDEQWNKLLSTLDDGLWQVRGRSPSEEYRKAIEQYQERIRQLTNTIGSGGE